MRIQTAGRLWLAGMLLAAVIPVHAADAPDVVVLKAARVHTLTGAPIDGGMVVIRAGRIAAVGRDLEIPAGAQVIDLPKAVITPGLIDACCSIDSEIPQSGRERTAGRAQPNLGETLADAAQRKARDGRGARESFGEQPPFPLPDEEVDLPGDRERPTEPTAAAREQAWRLGEQGSSAEQASEVTPHRRALDSVNLLSNDFTRLMKSGVTTVFVSPDTANVIGGRGAVVKTGGPLAARVVQRDGAVKAAMGSDPTQRGDGNNLPPTYGPTPSIHTRRPTTRMGVEWVFRKAFYDARRAEEGGTLHGADMPPAAALPELQAILAGKTPLRIQARMQHDIYTALRLTREFGLKFTLDEATEAYRCLPLLAEAGVPVIFGPLYMDPTGWRAQTDEVQRPRLNTPQQLAEAGIRFALTAQEQRDEQGLVRQGMLAVRNGLPAEQALQAITATPAELLGLQGEIGVLRPEARADVVVWSTEPFDATSRPLVVLIDGRVVYDARED